MKTQKFKYVIALLGFAIFLLGARNFLKTWQIVNDSAIDSVNLPAESKLHDIIAGFDKEMNTPFRIYPSVPASSILNISSNLVEKGDGSAQTTAPSDDLVNVFPDSTIDYQTGVTTGGTFRRNGGLWNIPSCTVGRYKRQVFVYRSADNVIDVTYSTESITPAGLENAGALFARLEGTPIGYIDLECTNAGGFQKTIGSATNVIEGKVGADYRIFRFGSGSGGGAGEVADFKIQSVSDPVATLKKGSIKLSDGRILTTYSGTGTDSSSYGVDLTLDLDAILGSDPVDATSYLLAIDLSACCDISQRVQVSDTLQYVYPIEQADFALLVGEDADSVNRVKYAPIGYIKSATTGTVWSGTGSSFSTMPIKFFSNPTLFANPIVFNQTRSVGTVGSVANDYGPLADTDFPTPANVHYYHLNGDANDDSSNTAINLTVNGGLQFNGKGLFGRENVANFDGVDDSLTSTSSYFKPGDTDHSFGATFTFDPSKPNQTLFAQWQNGTNNMLVRVASTSVLQVFMGGSSLISVDVSGYSFDEYHIAIVYTSSDNTTKLYINGKSVGAGVNAALTSSDNFTIGSYVAGLFYSGKIEDIFFNNSEAYTDAQINALYSKKFTNHKQIAGGHILTNDSFPFEDLTGKVAYWNLNDLNDDSGNGKTLTNNGGVTFSGLDIYGEARVAEFSGANHLSSIDSFFHVGNHDQSFMVIVDKENWNESGCPVLASNGLSTGDWSWTFCVRSNSGLELARAGIEALELPLVNNLVGKHIIGFTYKSSDRSVKFYVDGMSYDVGSFTADLNLTASPAFTLGARFITGTADYFTGTLHDAFWSPTLLSDEDIYKLASAKVDLPQLVAPENQDWSKSLWGREDGKINNQLKPDFIVDSSSNAAYVSFNSGEDKVNLKLVDTGLEAAPVSPLEFSTGELSAAPTFPINHGLGLKPAEYYVETQTQAEAGNWEKRYDLCSVNDTEIFCDLSGLTIDVTHKVKVVARVGSGSSITDASATTSGKVNTGAQTFAGDKEFTGAIKATGGFDTTGNAGLATDTVSGLITREFDSGVLDIPSPNWNGTPPNTLVSAKYRWIRNGNKVSVSWDAAYSENASSANNSSFTWALPASMPTPAFLFDSPATAEYMGYVGSGAISPTPGGTGNPALTLIFVGAGGSPYTFYTNSASTTTAYYARGSITYYTND